MIDQSSPSRSRVMPGRMSFVESIATDFLSWIAQPLEHDQFLRGAAERLLAVRRHHREVLDADPAPPREVDTRLDGDDLSLRQHVCAGGAQRRRLVDLDAHAVAEAVAERLAVAGAVDHVR